MKLIRPVIHKLSLIISDDSGGEVIEYALVVGLIIVVTISLIASFGVKAAARWTSVNSSM